MTTINRNVFTEKILLLCLLAFIASPMSDVAAATYELDVSVDPKAGTVEVAATLRVAEPLDRLEFLLNAGFSVDGIGVDIEAGDVVNGGRHRIYRASLPTPSTAIRLQYRGSPVIVDRERHGGMPEAVVSNRAVYLDGASAWFPRTGDDVHGLSMAVTLPDGWQSISIGKRMEKAGRVTWTTDVTHDDIYLIAGRYKRHARPGPIAEASVWLLEDDEDLAQRYLDGVEQYVAMYDQLIGDYPYAKFAVVENVWQTGFGMPSFTLLGSRVIRLPFILYTSLPHEILHNWWGNGVWVDYGAGNWSEGLTAYLSDHLIQAQRGKGAVYRQKALQRYSNFAAVQGDMALRSFVSRHNDASQSVGYSKSLMLFHMLRTTMGDEAFVGGLQRLWREHQFSRASFDEVIAALAHGQPEVAQRAVQWLDREGAVRIHLGETKVEPVADGYRLHLELTQDEPVFAVDVPIAVTVEGAGAAIEHRILLNRAETKATLTLPRRPLRVDIDPAFDVLRLLDPSEQPPVLSLLFGGETWMVLPSKAPKEQIDAWRRLAGQWQRRYPSLRVTDDLDRLPADANRLLLGWQNRLLDKALSRLQREGQQIEAEHTIVGGEQFDRDGGSVVLVNAGRDGNAVGFIGAATVADIDALARRLPHYGGYGQLVFDRDGGRNLYKAMLGPADSRLTRQLTPDVVPLQLAERRSLDQAVAGNELTASRRGP